MKDAKRRVMGEVPLEVELAERRKVIRKRNASTDDQITAEVKRLISEVMTLYASPPSIEEEIEARCNDIAARFGPPIMLATLLMVVPMLADRLAQKLGKQVIPNARRVVIESPYAGKVETNLRYLRAAMADCLRRGEAPFASHGLYTQPGMLDDDKPDERKLGIEAGFAWRSVADATIVYADLGITPGMAAGIEHAERDGRTVEYRRLGGEWAR